MDESDFQKRLSRIRSVAVYLASNDVADPVYRQAVGGLAKYLAAHRMTLIFGGSRTGNMAHLADTMLANGGKVVGIFTKSLPARLIRYDLTESVVTENLAARKAEMIRRSDVLIALPGSFGTWDEMFDALALRKLGTAHHPPVGVLNVNGYYDHLLAFIRHSVEVGFTAPKHADLLRSGTTPDELFRALAEDLPDADAE